ncbi:MAG: peptide ABC transporter substrate-binding protein, partial [Rhodospirillaceae bacterium]
DNPLIFEHLYMASIDARRTAVVLAAMMKQCGMVARLIAHEPRVHYNMIQEADFTSAVAAWRADYNDPHTFLYLLDSRSGVYNYAGYNNPVYDRLMDKAATILNVDERAKVLAEAEQIALDNVAVVPTSFPTSKLLVASYVKGFVPNAPLSHRNRWMWIER